MLRIRYQIPTCLQRLYGGVVWHSPFPRGPLSPSRGKGEGVLLSFDDGPTPGVTERVLEILGRYGVKATFFMLGEKAEKYPELVEKVRAAGHTIGNHSYSHLRGTRVSTRRYLADVERANALLTPSEKVEYVKLFRPPYGKMWPWQKWALLRRGYTIWLWDVLTYDYDSRYSAEDIVGIVKRYAREGSIILLHDSEKSGERMLNALPKIVER